MTYFKQGAPNIRLSDIDDLMRENIFDSSNGERLIEYVKGKRTARNRMQRLFDVPTNSLRLNMDHLKPVAESQRSENERPVQQSPNANTFYTRQSTSKPVERTAGMVPRADNEKVLPSPARTPVEQARKGESIRRSLLQQFQRTNQQKCEKLRSLSSSTPVAVNGLRTSSCFTGSVSPIRDRTLSSSIVETREQMSPMITIHHDIVPTSKNSPRRSLPNVNDENNLTIPETPSPRRQSPRSSHDTPQVHPIPMRLSLDFNEGLPVNYELVRSENGSQQSNSPKRSILRKSKEGKKSPNKVSFSQCLTTEREISPLESISRPAYSDDDDSSDDNNIQTRQTSKNPPTPKKRSITTGNKQSQKNNQTNMEVVVIVPEENNDLVDNPVPIGKPTASFMEITKGKSVLIELAPPPPGFGDSPASSHTDSAANFSSQNPESATAQLDEQSNATHSRIPSRTLENKQASMVPLHVQDTSPEKTPPNDRVSLKMLGAAEQFLSQGPPADADVDFERTTVKPPEKRKTPIVVDSASKSYFQAVEEVKKNQSRKKRKPEPDKMKRRKLYVQDKTRIVESSSKSEQNDDTLPVKTCNVLINPLSNSMVLRHQKTISPPVATVERLSANSQTPSDSTDETMLATIVLPGSSKDDARKRKQSVAVMEEKQNTESEEGYEPPTTRKLRKTRQPAKIKKTVQEKSTGNHLSNDALPSKYLKDVTNNLRRELESDSLGNNSDGNELRRSHRCRRIAAYAMSCNPNIKSAYDKPDYRTLDVKEILRMLKKNQKISNKEKSGRPRKQPAKTAAAATLQVETQEPLESALPPPQSKTQEPALDSGVSSLEMMQETHDAAPPEPANNMLKEKLHSLTWMSILLQESEERNLALPKESNSQYTHVSVEHLKFIRRENIEYSFYNSTDDEYFGFIRFLPNACKKLSRTKNFSMNFLLLSGKLTFCIAKTTVVEAVGGDFVTLPPSTKYEIRNSAEPSLMFIVKRVHSK